MDTTLVHPIPDYTTIKSKQNAAWSAGDYARVGTTLQIVGETLAENMDLSPEASVLDVAAGNGNASLAFARRGANVTSTDYVPALLEKGAARARAEGLDLRIQIADAESLPFTDGSFDAVVSTFGVMFAPNQLQCVSELLRVCRPGGKIGLANWTPRGFIGQLFAVLGRYVPPPAGLYSPARWGDRDWIESVFSARSDVSFETRDFIFRYRTPEHFLEFFRTYYGPVHKAYLALGEVQAANLTREIKDLVMRFNTAERGEMRVPSEYAQVILTRR